MPVPMTSRYVRNGSMPKDVLNNGKPAMAAGVSKPKDPLDNPIKKGTFAQLNEEPDR